MNGCLGTQLKGSSCAGNNDPKLLLDERSPASQASISPTAASIPGCEGDREVLKGVNQGNTLQQKLPRDSNSFFPNSDETPLSWKPNKAKGDDSNDAPLSGFAASGWPADQEE